MTARTETRSPETEAGHARDYSAIALAYAKAAWADKKHRRHCKWVRLAAKRHLDDLKRQRTSWGYRFDTWHANDVCDVIEKLPHIEGQWDTPTIVLEPFQIFILAVVFGWRVKATGLRRFTMVYEEEARKQGKSTKTAGVSIYCLACEDEPGAQVLTAATTFDQAKKVFHPAKRMIEKTPELQDAFGLIAWAKSITCSESGGYMQPIHAKSKSQDGHNPHLVTLDEFHAHADRGLFDVMRSAFGARRQPLMWIITTAGPNIHGPCYEERSFAIKVLEGTVVADHYFAIIFTLDRAEDFGDGRKVGDDPFDPAVWIKSNPLFDASEPLRAELAKKAIEAKENPAALADFKTKSLNIWSTSLSAWLNTAKWIAAGDETLSEGDFVGLESRIGGDLSAVDDLSALVLSAETADGQLLAKTRFYVPEARLENTDTSKKQVTDMYRRWVDEGHLIATPGDFIDHNVIEGQIRAWKTELAVKGVTFDQWNSGLAMASRLNEDFGDGETAFASQMAKNAANATDPAKAIEARVNAGPHRLRHDANPVMAWMIGNAFVDRRTNGSLLPKKETANSQNKIDGVDAMINAIAPMMLIEEDDRADLGDFLANVVAA